MECLTNQAHFNDLTLNEYMANEGMILYGNEVKKARIEYYKFNKT